MSRTARSESRSSRHGFQLPVPVGGRRSSGCAGQAVDDGRGQAGGLFGMVSLVGRESPVFQRVLHGLQFFVRRIQLDVDEGEFQISPFRAGRHRAEDQRAFERL